MPAREAACTIGLPASGLRKVPAVTLLGPGVTAATTVAGGIKLLEGSKKGTAAAHVVVTINDSGPKSLSTDLWA